MKKKLCSFAVAALALGCLTASCASGPRRLSRSWDNYVNQRYAENSYIHGALLQDIIPVYGIVGFVAAIGDALIVNPWYFWTEDVWDGKGTAFHYEDAEGAARTVEGPGF